MNDGLNKYIAGTQFQDTFTGENNVDNLYYYVGANVDINGPTPHDVFNGGALGTNGWNTAIFPDDAKNYTIMSSGGGYIITNVGDPAHSGQLTVDANVQVLAFNPAQDPSPIGSGELIATGDKMVVLTAFTNTAAIEGTATLEFANSFTGTVTEHDHGGTLQLDQPSSGSIPSVQIDGFFGNFLDLPTFDGATTTTSYAFDNPTGQNPSGTLTVDDNNGHTTAVTLSGDFSTEPFYVSVDSQGGAFIFNDHAPQAVADTIIGSADLFQSNSITIAGHLFLDNDTDADLASNIGEQLSIKSLDGSQTNGTVQLDGSGDVVYKLPTGASPPTAGQSASDQLAYTISDQSGLTSSTHATLIAEGGPNLVGTAGNDVLLAGHSAELLSGGQGSDTFVFTPTFGHDTIADFNVTADHIELDDTAITNNTELFNAISSSGADATHGDAVINLGGGDSITVTGVTQDYLQQHLSLIQLHSAGGLQGA